MKKMVNLLVTLDVLAFLLLAYYVVRLKSTDKYLLNKKDSTIVIQQNAIASLGHKISAISIENKELRNKANELGLRIRYLSKSHGHISTTGKTIIKVDTVFITRTDFSLHRTFSLLSNDSSIYVHGKVYPDSIVADTMTADITFNTYIGFGPNGEPWTLVTSPNKNVTIHSNFKFAKYKNTRPQLFVGAYYDNAPGIIGTVKYHDYYIGLGYNMKNGKMISVQKEVRF